MREFKKAAVPRPPHSLRLPNNTSDIDLEIGAGCGQHAISYVQCYQARHMIAIERTKTKFEKLQQLYVASGSPTNLCVIRGDVVNILAHTDCNEAFSKIFILYPNPEPNNKNQRWIYMPFFSYLWQALKKGGTLTMATNISSYAEDFYNMAESQWQIQDRRKAILPNTYKRSLFEKKYQERGETCWQVDLRKNTSEF